MSRWNQREHHVSPYTGTYDYDDRWASWPTGNVIVDLRFFAGCKRTPQRVRREVARVGYSFGCSEAVQSRAREIEGGIRARLRAFAAEVAKTSRAGGDVGELLEPDARTRHEAVWDCD